MLTASGRSRPARAGRAFRQPPTAHGPACACAPPPRAAARICPRSAGEPSSADRGPPYLCPRGHPAPRQPRAPHDSHLGWGCARGCNSCASSPSAAAGFISPRQQRGGWACSFSLQLLISSCNPISRGIYITRGWGAPAHHGGSEPVINSTDTTSFLWHGLITALGLQERVCNRRCPWNKNLEKAKQKEFPVPEGWGGDALGGPGLGHLWAARRGEGPGRQVDQAYALLTEGGKRRLAGGCYESYAHGRNEKFFITSLCMLCCSADAESEARRAIIKLHFSTWEVAGASQWHSFERRARRWTIGRIRRCRDQCLLSGTRLRPLRCSQKLLHMQSTFFWYSCSRNSHFLVPQYQPCSPGAAFSVLVPSGCSVSPTRGDISSSGARAGWKPAGGEHPGEWQDEGQFVSSYTSVPLSSSVFLLHALVPIHSFHRHWHLAVRLCVSSLPRCPGTHPFVTSA